MGKSFKCNYCDKKFHQMIHLINHSRTHTQERPFKCQICGFNFSEKSSLLRHIQALHKDVSLQEQQQMLISSHQQIQNSKIQPQGELVTYQNSENLKI